MKFEDITMNLRSYNHEFEDITMKFEDITMNLRIQP